MMIRKKTPKATHTNIDRADGRHLTHSSGLKTVVNNPPPIPINKSVNVTTVRIFVNIVFPFHY